jgi:hypothetical protein
MPADDGVRRCLRCHTTNPRAVLARSGPESVDHSIGCEVCHGPGGHHVVAVAHKYPDRAIISPGRTSGAAINELCGRCHGLTEPKGYFGEPDDPGWFRFQTARLEKSRCFTAANGALHCVTCHDPHTNADTSAGHYDTSCLSCHGGPGKTACPTSATKGCVECHMPRVWREQTHSYKIDHRIRVQKTGSARG